MNKKISIGIIALIAAIALGYYGVTQLWAKPKVEQKTAVAKQGTLKIAFAIDGKTAIERRDLKFEVNGKVARVYVKEGQTVKKGQLLMSLDAADVQKNLERDLKDYLIARNTFDQTTQVTYPDGATTDTLKRVLQNTQYTLDKSVLDVEIQNIAIKESRLYAPIAGVISALNIKEGETTNTQSSNVVATVTVPGSLVFEAYAEDTDILKISNDQKTNIMIDAIPNVSLPSNLAFISNLATIDTNGLASYKVRATISDLRGYNILDGMAGQIEFVTKEKSGILIIPNTAVTRRENESYVIKVANDKTNEVVVETGFTDGKEVEISSGLNSGDVVVLP